MGNYHVPFWRAVGVVTPSLTLIILKKGIATAGHVGSSGLDCWAGPPPSTVNAWGDLSSTGNDVNQSQQDRSLNQESPSF